MKTVEGDRPRRGPGTDRAAPGLELRSPHSHSLVPRLAPRGRRRRAGEGLRRRAARRRGSCAARRPAAGDPRGAPHLRPAQGGRPRPLLPARRPLRRSLRAADRSSPRRARCPPPPGCSPGPARWSLPTATPQQRDRGQATAADGLALGFAQAAALAPGVSRNGATLSVARWRGFTRQHANMLSRTVALPVIVGAAVLKGARLRRRGLPRDRARRLPPGPPPRSARPSPLRP